MVRSGDCFFQNVLFLTLKFCVISLKYHKKNNKKSLKAMFNRFSSSAISPVILETAGDEETNIFKKQNFVRCDELSCCSSTNTTNNDNRIHHHYNHNNNHNNKYYFSKLSNDTHNNENSEKELLLKNDFQLICAALQKHNDSEDIF